MTPGEKYKIMFLCTANSCRSQMAEGLARHFGEGIIEPCSAGLFAHYVHPGAIHAMKEIDIDISGQKSKDIDKNILKDMDIIVTLCGNAEAACPVVPAEIKRIHWPINDPVGAVGTGEEIRDAFRRARDEIKGKIQDLIEDLKSHLNA